MAKKDKFMSYELETYQKLVTSYGAAASAPLAKNLERELAAHKDPAKIDWALKLVAFRALQDVGTASAAHALEKFTADKTTFTETSVDRLSNQAGTSKHLVFGLLASDALLAVLGRNG
jgi:hypothetical protein